MALGSRIREAREERGLTQEALGSKCAPPISQGVITALETRDSRKSVYAEALCAALGIRLSWALTGEGPKYVYSPEPKQPALAESTPFGFELLPLTKVEVELISGYRAANKTGKLAIISSVKALAAQFNEGGLKETLKQAQRGSVARSRRSTGAM